MKLLVAACLALLPFALGANSLKSVVVTYPHETPDSVVESAKQALIDAGGMITHEYHLIKGFAAQASVNALQSLSTLSTSYSPSIEEDKIVSVDGEFIGAQHAY